MRPPTTRRRATSRSRTRGGRTSTAAPTAPAPSPARSWLQNYNLSVRGGGQTLQYFLSGAYENDALVMPQDSAGEVQLPRQLHAVSPVENLQVQWNTGWSPAVEQEHVHRQQRTGRDPERVPRRAELRGLRGSAALRERAGLRRQQQIERLSTGVTLTYTPLADLTNRFTVGYDFTQQEGRNLRPFGFEQYPEGSLTNDTWQNRVLTFDYVGTYSFPLTEMIRSNFSWGGQAVGDEERRSARLRRELPGRCGADHQLGLVDVRAGRS